MGRREKPVDPAAGPIGRFAHALRKLREDAGTPTYRAMARRAGYAAGTLAAAAGGQKLPSLPVTLAYVSACGGDVAEWERRWREAAHDQAVRPPRADEAQGAPPYRGLARYEPGDHDVYFGRGRLTDDLVHLVSEHRFTAVFGPSGSGKSSLLRAGLIPRLQHAHHAELRPAALRILTPGPRPLHTHRRACRPADAHGDTWLVVDQFEEVFTLCRDPRERADFIDLLLTAHAANSRLRVVLGVRADFYGRFLEHRKLATAVRDASLPVGPMSHPELREAITKPAAAAGLLVERALTARLIEEVTEQPGGLPLLSHTLLETWRRRDGRTLTLQAYEATGGIHGAIAQTAEDLYARLSPPQAVEARRVLLRMIAPGDGTQDTRRPVDRAELDTGASSGTDAVIDQLARARLITLDQNTVDLAHEALISSWPRLRGWVEEDRERLRMHRRLTDAARAWAQSRHDAGGLYRGTRLSAAAEVFTDRQQDLTALERAFLTASRTHHIRKRLRRHLLQGAMAVLVVLALVSGLIAWQQKLTNDQQLVRAAALRVAKAADGMRAAAPQRAQLLSLAAYRLADLPETRSTLLKAMTQKEHDVFIEPDHIPGARHFLSQDGRRLVCAGQDRVLVWDVPGHRKVVQGTGMRKAPGTPQGVSPDGRTLTVSRGGVVRLWDVAAGRTIGAPMKPAPRDPGSSLLAEFGPTGHTLLTRSAVHGRPATIRLWHPQRRRLLLERRLPNARGTPVAAVSADDRWMAVCAPGLPLEIWDVARQRRRPLSAPRSARHGACKGLRFSPDSRHLAASTPAGVRVWSLTQGQEEQRIKTQGTLRRAQGALGMAFSPNGRYLATLSNKEILVQRINGPSAQVFQYPVTENKATALSWDRGGRVLRYSEGAQGPVHTLAVAAAVEPAWQSTPTQSAIFSPDGLLLAAAAKTAGTHRLLLRDGRSGRTAAVLGTIREPKLPLQPGKTAEFTDLMAFASAGRTLAHSLGTTSPNRPPARVAFWDTRTQRKRAVVDLTGSGSSRDGVSGIVLSADGQTLWAAQPGGRSFTAWDVGRRALIKAITPRHTPTERSAGQAQLAVRPDGQLLVTSHHQVADLRTGRVAYRILAQGSATVLAFSPDGKQLAVGNDSGQVTLWDGTARQRVAVLSGSFTSIDRSSAEPVSALAYSPDGRTLAVGGGRGSVQLWDVSLQQKLGGELLTPKDRILSLAVSEDGATLYATGRHVPLHRYAIAPEKVATQVCRRTTASLSRTVWKLYLPEIPYRKVC